MDFSPLSCALGEGKGMDIKMENSNKNEIPDFQSIRLPLLEYFGDGKEHITPEIVEHVSNVFHLSDDQRNELIPSGLQTTIFNSVLIDSDQLAQLMMYYDVGVTTSETYEIKKVDSDYFSEE